MLRTGGRGRRAISLFQEHGVRTATGIMETQRRVVGDEIGEAIFGCGIVCRRTLV
jgi:hypothetical protein